MPEQKDAAHASDSKEAHTDIHQAPNNVSHTGEVATADDSSVVKCGEGPCDAGGSAASARSDAGEVMRSTAADLHPCKKGIVVISGNLRLYPVDSFFRPKAVARDGASSGGGGGSSGGGGSAVAGGAAARGTPVPPPPALD